MISFPPLLNFEGKKVLFLAHAGADIDSMCSAASFFFSLKKNKQCVIGVPDHISLHAKMFCTKMGIPFTINPANPDSFDAIFLLDFNSAEMAGSFSKKIVSFPKKVFIIDHHENTSRDFSKAFLLVDKKAVSCTEVVFRYLSENNAKISKKVAILLACGIIVDSGRFSTASKNTFHLMDFLVKKSGKDYSVFFSLLEIKKDLSERIAALKAAKRARVFGSFEKIISASEVNAFEATAAMSLVFLGSDVSFAAGEKNGKVVLSARAKNSFVGTNSFDLVRDVFVPLSKKFSGQGGGHPAAAAFNGQGFEPKDALYESALLVHAFLEKKHGKKSGLKEYT